MDIRLIVSDIDRTLLPGSQILSPATVQAVRAARARGVEFAVASGRWYPSARAIVSDQLGIEDGYMIVCNGGAVMRCDGSVLMEGGMDARQARAVYEIFHGARVMMTSYVCGAIYRLHSQYLTVFRLPEVGGYFGGSEYRIVDDDEEAFVRFGLERPYKMEAYCDDAALLKELRGRVEAAGLQVNSSFPFNLEVMAPGTGKGAATRFLTERLGLRRDQVMGFGDYTNDLPMLENVGWPVAVGNALDEVKRACRIIAPACEDDGVAKTIQKYILGDEEA